MTTVHNAIGSFAEVPLVDPAAPHAPRPGVVSLLVDARRRGLRVVVVAPGPEVVQALEQQYDAFHTGSASLLADDQPLPSGEELGEQFEQFLARLEDPEE